MSKVRPYDVIFVDWYGTLSVTHFWHHWAETQPEIYPELVEVFTRDSQNLIPAWMRGQLTSKDFVNALATELNFDTELLYEGLEQSSKNFNFINPGLPGQLQQLRQVGYRVVLATDNMDCFRNWTVPTLRLTDFMDDLLISPELGAIKSDIEPNKGSLFFANYLEKHEIPSGRSLLIDDLAELQFLTQHGIDVLTINKGEDISSHLTKLLAHERPAGLMSST